MKASKSPARKRATKAQVADGSCPLYWATWVAHNGRELPQWMEVMRHSCDVGLCVNPEHLTPGTQIENARDRKERGRNGSCWEAEGNRCRRGHDMTRPENVAPYRPRRLCRPCNTLRAWCSRHGDPTPQTREAFLSLRSRVLTTGDPFPFTADWWRGDGDA